MKPSKISWTDYSGQDLNFVTGCTAVSEGCENCYARAIYERFGRDFRSVRYSREKLARCSRLRTPQWSPKRGEGHRSMAFVCDTGDLFHNRVSGSFLLDALNMMSLRQDVIWQVLTKRPAEMRQVLLAYYEGFRSKPLPNIWLGVTAENQKRADERIPILLDTPAAVHFVSCEPLLGPINIADYLPDFGAPCSPGCLGHISQPCERCGRWWGKPALSWVICGGESGPNRRPFDVAWAVDLYEQCKGAGTPFFYKQGSSLRPGQNAELPSVGKVQEWPLDT